MNRAVGIEGGIETHAGAYTDSLYLPLCIDGRSHRVPTEQGHWAINLGIKPTLVDPMGQTIGENGCGGCFQIGVGTVKQLVPKTVLVLKGCQSLGMAAKLGQYWGIRGLTGEGRHWLNHALTITPADMAQIPLRKKAAMPEL